MSDYHDEFDDDYDENNTPKQGTHPAPSQGQPPVRGARRPIPADDMPPVYERPSLSRRQSVQPQPPIQQPSNPTVRGGRPTPPSDYYNSAEPPMMPPPARSTDRRRNQQNEPSNRRAERRANRANQVPAAPRPKKDRSRDGLYLPWWSLVILLVFVACVAFGALAVASSLDPNVAPQTPVVVVITSTFTVGPPATQTPLPQAPTTTATKPLPTIPPTLTLPPGNFAIGEPVQVIGVGESGLNVRSAPGVDGAVKFRALDGETYVLKDGPQSASNDEWWFIQDRTDQNKGGWASRRYLTVQVGVGVPSPTPPVIAP